LARTSLTVFRSRAALELEDIALRHQLAILNRSVQRPRTVTARQSVLGLALRALGRIAVGTVDLQTGNRDRMAPQGIPAVLDLENTGAANPVVQQFRRRFAI